MNPLNRGCHRGDAAADRYGHERDDDAAGRVGELSRIGETAKAVGCAAAQGARGQALPLVEWGLFKIYRVSASYFEVVDISAVCAPRPGSGGSGSRHRHGGGFPDGAAARAGVRKEQQCVLLGLCQQATGG